MLELDKMLKRSVATLLIIAASIAAVPTFVAAAGENTVNVPNLTDYAPINGLNMYFEVHGDGPPLVMLHGGVNPSEMFGSPLAAMARTHKVIAVHLQGHGFTKDTDRPWSYERSADDVAALLKHLRIERANLMGYSFGAGVALQTAVRHPSVVEKLVVISTAFRSDGEFPEITTNFERMPSMAESIANAVGQSPLAQLYPDVNWEMMFIKTGKLHSEAFDWSEQVAGIKNPTLLIFADADIIHPKHMAEFYNLMGGGLRDAGQDGSLRSVNQMAVIPGRTHYNLLGSKAVTDIATDFLQD